MSAKPTTGRYDTRAELCQAVWRMYLHTPAKQSHVARACRVSVGVVAKIIGTHEGYQQAKEKA